MSGIIKYISQIPKEGYTWRTEKISNAREGGVPRRHRSDEDWRGKSTQRILTSNYRASDPNALMSFNKKQRRIQSNNYPLSDTAFLDFADVYLNARKEPDETETLIEVFSNTHGVLGNVGAGEEGDDSLRERHGYGGNTWIAKYRFMEEAQVMYEALVEVSDNGKLNRLKEIFMDRNDIEVNVAVEKFRGKWQIVHVPQHLLGAMWLQFFDSLSSDRVRKHGTCKWCGTIYQKNRSDQKFCTASHKAMHNRVKKVKRDDAKAKANKAINNAKKSIKGSK